MNRLPPSELPPSSARLRGRLALSAWLAWSAAFAGCVGDPGATSSGGTGGSKKGSGGASASGGSSSPGSGGSSTGGSTSGSGGSGSGSGGTSGGSGGSGDIPTSAYLPARVRRLTNAEYDASVKALLGSSMAPSATLSFPPDARQGSASSPAGPAFTVNDAQRVDPVMASKLDTAALALVAEARTNGKLTALAPCSNSSGSQGEACAKTFVQNFGAKVYRRPLLDTEVNALVSGSTSAYHVGADGYTYNDGIDLLTRILLQSAGFIYVTEIGDGSGAATFTLTPNETASALSFMLTSGPPDDALMSAASGGMLATPDGREQQARRLLATANGRGRLVRVVREWLGIEDVGHREKAQSVYPDFAGVSASMENESLAFIDDVMANGNGSISQLLGADWTMVDAPLAKVYGVTSAGTGKRTSLTSVKRRGILNQGAFLSVFATNNGSHPVFRGVATMRRVACLNVADPGALGLVVSFPAADPSMTTRQRFEKHAQDQQCAGCHTSIDKFGFAFEGFDGMGKARSTENNLPVDSTTTIAAGTDFDGDYADSNALATAMASSATVRTCVARQLFRSAVGRSDTTSAPSENAFIDLWKGLSSDKQDRLGEVLVALVRSPLFVQRRTP